ncbi:unnamed protein product [Miscanthus lutarioriparius]|uniref:Uncharacterized protein n=1 Tax=Miscanthus lutarioriparius TaxID=422564 RepID=A0A811NTB3_9POAL|nr:unnamed protein product [Miscanthus lutarioriparius]
MMSLLQDVDADGQTPQQNMYSFNIKSDNVENLDVRSLKRSCLHGNIKNYNCHQQRNSAAIPGSQQQLACAMMAVQWLLFLVSP